MEFYTEFKKDIEQYDIKIFKGIFAKILLNHPVLKLNVFVCF